MLKDMENEMEIFRAWLQKYVQKDRRIKGVVLASKLGISKASVSSYITGRIINGERKFTQIPFEIREKIIEITGISHDRIMKEGREILSPNNRVINETITDSMGLEDDNNLFKLNDPLEAEHLSVIRQFKNKDMACSINKKLVELEALDSTSFAEIIVEIKRKIDEAKALKKRSIASGDR